MVKVKSKRIRDVDELVSQCLSLYESNVPFLLRLNDENEILIQLADSGLPVIYGNGTLKEASALFEKDLSYRYVSPASQVAGASEQPGLSSWAGVDRDKDFSNFAALRGLAIIGKHWCRFTRKAIEAAIRRGYDFQYYDLKNHRAGMYTEKMGIITSPVVLLNGSVVGGCEDFCRMLSREGEQFTEDLNLVAAKCSYVPLGSLSSETLQNLLKNDYRLIVSGSKKMVRICPTVRLSGVH